jgi:hypothetical protein
MLESLTESRLGLMELLELRRRRARCSFGLEGFRPDCRAKRLRISVKDMTPVNRPDIRAPGRADAETAGKAEERDGNAGPLE